MSVSDTAIRILVMAQYPLARAGLAALLGGFDDLLVVGQTAGAEPWAALVDELTPDVLLLDLPAGDEEALERLERTLAEQAGLAAVILTAGDGRAGAPVAAEGLAEALGAGARGYLPREVAGEELAAAIRAVAAGFLVLAPALAAPLTEGRGAPRAPRRAPGRRRR